MSAASASAGDAQPMNALPQVMRELLCSSPARALLRITAWPRMRPVIRSLPGAAQMRAGLDPVAAVCAMMTGWV